MKLLTGVMASLLVLAPAAAAQAPKKNPPPKKEVRAIRATGCVIKAVEGGCLLLRTLDGKTTYNILANPQPEVGTVITIDAKPHTGPTACMQGIPVDVTSWESTGEKCTR